MSKVKSGRFVQNEQAETTHDNGVNVIHGDLRTLLNSTKHAFDLARKVVISWITRDDHQIATITAKDDVLEIDDQVIEFDRIEEFELRHKLAEGKWNLLDVFVNVSIPIEKLTYVTEDSELLRVGYVQENSELANKLQQIAASKEIRFRII